MFTPLKKELNGNEKKFFPIRYKIILPYLTLAIIVSIIGAFLLSNIVFDSLEDRYINQLIEVGKLASESIVEQEKSLLSSLRLLANLDGVSEALEAEDIESLRNLSFGVVVENQIEDVEFLNAQGQHLLSMVHKHNGNVEEYEFASLSDIKLYEWDVVEKVIHQENDGIGNKYAGYLLHNRKQTFFVAGPVYNQSGDFVGVLLVGQSLDQITRKIRETTLAQITLYNHEGEILSTTLINPVPLNSAVTGEVLEKQDDYSVLLSEKERREISSSGIDYDELLGPWEIREDADIGILGTALVKSFIVTFSTSTITQTIFFLVLSIIFIVLIGVFVSEYITHPLPEFVTASQKISDGNLSVSINADTNDELGLLADNFNHMVNSLSTSKKNLLRAYDETLLGWAKALELRDSETEGHTIRVTKKAIDFARAIGIKGADLVNIQRGALLHDIGKIGVPDTILKNSGPLSQKERRIMETHTQLGHDMLWDIDYLRPAIDIPYYHHENWDGSGYPHGLKGKVIPLAARLFAIVDVWDALRSDRVYRKAYPDDKVLKILKSDRGIKYDPELLDIFIKLID
ncbi:MAG: HD domain-containing protein [Anaerolineaceae bacterium]|nr:HD domain-containing protein [Anaerolineaceae bacterium]